MSAILYNRRPVYWSKIKEKCKEYSSPINCLLLWVFSGIYTAAHVSLSHNISGLTIIVPVGDLLVVLFLTYILHKGLLTKNYVMVLPWLLLTTQSIYFNQYLSLLSTLSTLKIVKKQSQLHWFSIGVNSVSIGLRCLLVLRLLQLCVYMFLYPEEDHHLKKSH